MSSVAEVVAALGSVHEQLLQAHQVLNQADGLIGESLAALAKAGKHHSQSLVPPELLGASQAHQRTVELVTTALDRLETLMTSL